DTEEAGEAPQHERRKYDQCKALAAEIAAAGDKTAQTVLAAAQNFLKVGWRRTSALLRAGAPRPLRSRTPRTAAALIAPWHWEIPPAPERRASTSRYAS